MPAEDESAKTASPFRPEGRKPFLLPEQIQDALQFAPTVGYFLFRLQFFHERSPYADSRLNVYPIGRYFGTAPLPAVREAAFRRKQEPE